VSLKQKTPYRIRTWPEYNAALSGRGSLTLWVDEQALPAWRYSGPPHRGAQYVDAEAALQGVLTLRVVYHLALRATAGVARSGFAWLGTAWPVPSYRTLARRGAEREVALGVRPRSEPLHVVSAASGFKGYGAGEGKVRQHGWRKRRTWRKRHSGVDETTGEMVAAVAREASVTEDDALGDWWPQGAGEMRQGRADGADDQRKGDEALEEYGARAVLPPRRAAKSWQQGNVAGEPWQRAENLRASRRLGRRRWKQAVGYHRRSVAETAVFRVKTIFGAALAARTFAQQATALFLKVAALNRMTQLGMPQSYPLAA
jgi:hypothetical protein